MKKSLLSNFFKGAAVFGFTLFSLNSISAQVNVSVGNLDTPNLWVGYASWFLNDGNYESNLPLTYDNGNAWGVADIKSVLDASANTISLYPNYNAYDATNTTWSDGAGGGNRIFEGNTYVERTDLAGQQLVFSGKTLSSTLLPAFKDTAFIKILNPANGYATEFVATAALTAGENFTLSTGNFVIQPGRLVQYGFTVLGKNANPTQMAANGFTVVTADEPQVSEGNIVTMDTTTPNVEGYATWYQPDGTTWIGGSVYGVADLKTTMDMANNHVVLQPNFLAYQSGGAEWQNGAVGSRVFEANTYVVRDDLLGQTVTFKGHTFSNTLATGYVATAFVKVLNADYSAILSQQTAALVGGQDWDLTLDTSTVTGGAHVQYGFIVKGLNANPTQEAALGSAVVGLPTAGVADFTKNAVVMYPNPASNVLNFGSENAIEGIQVYNVMGQKVIDAKPAQNNASVDVSGLTSGVYIVNTTINGKQSSARFIKQ